jgi:hypothetical protein
LVPGSIALDPRLDGSSNSWSRKGLVRNSIAPDLIACTDIEMSP